LVQPSSCCGIAAEETGALAIGAEDIDTTFSTVIGIGSARFVQVSEAPSSDVQLSFCCGTAAEEIGALPIGTEDIDTTFSMVIGTGSS
jgi:hypothetical protein